MSLQEIKNLKSEKGFTIVELLIVIVVIGILAAIVIVAYQGVTARANTSKAQTNATSVQKKAEAYNADTDSTNGGNGVYPATTSAFPAASTNALGVLPAGVSAVPSGTALTTSNGTTTVQYIACATGAKNTNTASGYIIKYFDFTNTSTPKVIWGGAATSSTCPTGTTASDL